MSGDIFFLAGENVIDGTFDLQVFSAFRGTRFYQIAFRTMNVHIRCQIESWLVGCFGFNGPLRQYFSLYRAVSQRVGERGEKG